jgi:hypothetical protein
MQWFKNKNYITNDRSLFTYECGIKCFVLMICKVIYKVPSHFETSCNKSTMHSFVLNLDVMSISIFLFNNTENLCHKCSFCVAKHKSSVKNNVHNIFFQNTLLNDLYRIWITNFRVEVLVRWEYYIVESHFQCVVSTWHTYPLLHRRIACNVMAE